MNTVHCSLLKHTNTRSKKNKKKKNINQTVSTIPKSSQVARFDLEHLRFDEDRTLLTTLFERLYNKNKGSGGSIRV